MALEYDPSVNGFFPHAVTCAFKKYLSILDPNADRSLFNTKSIEASLP